MLSKFRRSLLLIGAVCAASPTLLAQATEDCGATAPALSVGVPFLGTTEGATQSATLAASTCGRYDGSGGLFDVFARFTPLTTGTYRLSTCGSATDTVVSVHTACPVTDANVVDCGDDDDFCPQFTASTVTVKLFAGVEYHVRIATPYYGTPDTFTLSLSELPAVANDECSGAVAVTPGATVNGTNVNATGKILAAPGCILNTNGDGADVWYSVAITTPGVYTFDLTATNGRDLVLTLQDGCPGNQIACNDNDWVVNRPRLIKELAAGSYSLRVAGTRVSTGRPEEDAFTLAVSAAATPLGNDQCANAAPITAPSTTIGTTTGSTADGFAQNTCHSLDRRDVWYALTVPSVAQYEISLESSGDFWGAGMTLFASCGANELACSGSSFKVFLDPNTTYLLRVAGDFDGTGDFTVTVDAGTPIPPNDSCLTPAIATIGATNGTNAASSGFDETPHCGYADEGDVWFVFTAPGAGFYTFDTSGSTGLSDSTIALFDVCGGLPVVCNDNIAGQGSTWDGLSRVGHQMAAGAQVFVRVAGTGSSTGAFTLNISGPGAAPAVPSNDTFENARLITGDNYTDTVDPRAATPDVGSTCLADDLSETKYGVWYRFVAQDHGILTFTETGSNAHSVTSFYTLDDSPPILSLPLQCGEVVLRVQPGETHLFLVGVQSVEYPAGSYEVHATFRAQVGCCETSSGCVVTRQSACTGTWNSDLCGPSITATGGSNLPLTMPNPATNNNPAYVSSVLNVSDTSVISNLSVTVQLTHNSANQVVLRLITPWGATIQLLTGTQATSAFSGTYTFSDIGLQTIQEVGATQFPLPDGTYPANNPIGTVVAGHSAAGQWTLAAGDDTRNGALGRVDGWSLKIHAACASACPADFNNDGSSSIDDLFLYLNAWFQSNPSADFNQSGDVSIDDLFLFLNAWFTGC